MIPYIEIIDKYTLKKYALIEPKECWFELSYYDVGQCEIYCIASKENLAALQKGAYVKMPNERFIWVIKSITYTYNSSGGRMILARGKECKDILSKRIIKEPYELPLFLVPTITKLINDNIINPTDNARKINNFTIDTAGTQIKRIDPLQATRGNLLDFINNLLKAYNVGSYVSFENSNLVYRLIFGRDLTNSVVFSQSRDNLLSSEFSSNDDKLKTFAEIVSKFTETDASDNSIDVYYTSYKDLGQTGIDRSEMLVSSDISTTYLDSYGVKQTVAPTDPLYISWQVEEGKKALSENKTEEKANGEIDLYNTHYIFDQDYFIGDIVKIHDEYFNFSSNARITKITFKQSAEGYGQELEYEEEQQ